MITILLLLLAPAKAGPVLHLDFRRPDPALRLAGGPRRVEGPFGAALEFTGPLQYAEAPFARRLDGIEEITLAGWVFPRRPGEQAFFFRGLPETAPGGERMFPPRPGWVNFVLGTDGHGFLLATANGNGSMPFPHVTANTVPIDAWSHLAYVKDARGRQTFFLNGTEIHAFALDMVQAGFVALAADYLRDGERIAPGRRPYDTTDFCPRFPDWSVHGKDAWDTMRAIDWLQSLPEVDPERIGMVGHSYGGHSTIFTMALEPRIKAAWANGPVSDFLHHGLHWAVPRGAGASQSMPALRPYVLDRTRTLPVTFWEFTALAAPRPLAVGQAVGERRPFEEENHAAVRAAYDALGAGERLRYAWYPGDHDFPPAARQAAVDWLRRWLGEAPSVR